MHEYSKRDAMASHGTKVTIKKAIAVCLIGLLVTQVEESTGADADCNYFQQLEAGQTYYMYNPEYPNNYRTPRSCTWIASSENRVRLSCFTMDLPASRDCAGDHIQVDIGSTYPLRYCGTNWFIAESKGTTMNVTLNASRNPGRFLCMLEAITRNDDNCRCGWKNPSRIVGGIESGVNEFPMMAGLVDSERRLLYCGATIISSRHVITAAHCVASRNQSVLGVIVGEHDTSTGADTNATKLFRVARITIHPNYISSTSLNDIAIVEVQGIIPFSNEVGPACLPVFKARDSFYGEPVELTGWGTLELAGEKSNTLQKVRVGVVPYQQCVVSYNDVTPNQLCTSGTDGKDACQFDSGGPVLWQNYNSGRLVISAVISYGQGCATGTPAVNTRVGSYMEWILSIVRGERICMKE